MATEAEIKRMKRGELNELAAEYGIDPDQYRRADDLRSAIFEHLYRPEPTSDEEVAADTEDTDPATEEEQPKQRPNPPRPRIERQSRRYQDARASIDKSHQYSLEEAVDLALQTATVRFDAALEAHINLNVDPKQADQLVRGTVVLPHGSGKSQTVAAIAPSADDDDIAAAGADQYGADTLIAKLEKGEIDFDVLVAHPDVMKDLSKFAKTLGPQGLMPSPKAGTVTPNVAETVRELKAGRVEYRVDRYGNIHQLFGRASFTPEQLHDNFLALYQAITQQKPNSVKGAFVDKATINATMGPGIKLDLSSIS